MILTAFLLLISLILAQTTLFGVPRDTSTSLDPSSTQTLSVISIKSNFTAISPDGKTLLLYNFGTNSIGVYDVSNLESPTLSSSITFESSSKAFVSAVISSDSKTGYIVHDNMGIGELMIVDLSDILSPVTLTTYSLSAGAGPIAISPDDQTIFIWACMTITAPTVMIIDVSNSTSPNMLSTFAYQYGYCATMDTTLYVNGDSLIYYSASTLSLLNISDLTSPALLHTFGGLENAVGLTISSDGKNAFVIGGDPSIYANPVSMQIYNLSNLTSLQEINSLILPPSIDISGPGAMAISSDNNYIFIAGCDSLLIVNVSDVNNLSYQTIDTISGPTFVALSPNGRTLFVTSELQLMIVELYFDIKLSQKFTFPNNTVNLVPLSNDSWNSVNEIILSSDQNIAFMLDHDGVLAIFDVSNKTASKLLSEFKADKDYFVSIVLSPDEKTAFIACYLEILVVNISDLASPTLISTIPSLNLDRPHFAISSDGQIGFSMPSKGLLIVNVSDLTAPANITMYNVSEDYQTVAFALSEDEQTIFLLLWSRFYWSSYSLETIDVSNLSNPTMMSSFSIHDDSDDERVTIQDIFSVSISPDSQAAFINLYVIDDDLKVYDLSNPASPVEVDWSDYNLNTSQPVIISSDSSTAFVATSTELLVIDITKLSTPLILRAYPAPDTVSIFLSPDESTAYLGTTNGSLITVNLQPQYAVEMWNNDFMLGEVYTNTLVPFQINDAKQFVPMSQNFSFLAMSLYSVTSLPNTVGTETVTTYPLLPNWIDFDQSHGIVTFQPNSLAQIGVYQIYSAMSIMIPDDVFVGIGNITNETESLDLIVSLISLGYINTQGFLTSNFNPNSELYLQSEYSSLESEIRGNLSGFYIEMTTPFAVDSSIFISSSQHISVNTKSQNSLSVIISLIQGNTTQAQFVQGNYPVIFAYSSNQSSITMEGSLSSINTVLTQIIINLDGNLTSCNGTITISDGLNPLQTENITNISNFFIVNQPPNIAYSIQDEINQLQIYTGEQFIININGTFTDPNSQDLEYSVAMQDSTQQVPDWLTMRDFSLVGTPPEQVTGSEIDLVITAKNQFKSSQQLVTLHIKISLIYALKLIGTYGGAFITVVGLWIYMSTIHNIFCKRRYRYPKDFYIKVGDENSVRNICSISFIAKEIRVSKIVLKEIKKMIAEERKIKTWNMADVPAYFFDSHSGRLDEDKLIQMIKKAMLKLGMSDIDQYDESSCIKGFLRKNIVKQVIFNKILDYQLYLDEEDSTRYLFNVIKRDWVLLVETTRDPLQYRLNKTALQKRLLAQGVKDYRPEKDSNRHFLSEKDYINNGDDTIELNNQLSRFDEDPPISLREDTSQEQSLTPLVRNDLQPKRSKVNFDLLERSLIAFAFRYHNLDVSAYDIKVIVSQTPFGNRLWLKTKKLVKRDLASIEFAGKGEAAYGIKYEVKKGVLRFSGAPEEDLGGEKLIVQVTSKRGWILREFWLNCIASSVKVDNM